MSTNESLFFCEYCNGHPEGFTRRGHLKRHIDLQHCFGNIWRCGRLVNVEDEERECGKEVKSKEMLKEHIGSEHERLHYKCRHSWCSKEYKRPSNLCTHERRCWPTGSQNAILKVKRPPKRTTQHQQLVEGRAAYNALWAAVEAEPTRVAPNALVEGARLSSSTRPRRRRGQAAFIAAPFTAEPSSSEAQHSNYFEGSITRQAGTSVPMNIPFYEGNTTIAKNPWAHQQPNTGFNFFATPSTGPSTLPPPPQPHHDRRLLPGHSSSHPNSLPPVQEYDPTYVDTTNQGPFDTHHPATSFILDSATITIPTDNANVDAFAQQELPMNRQRASSRSIRHHPYARPSRSVRPHLTLEQAFGSSRPGMLQTAPDIDGPLIGYGEGTTGLQYSQHASHSRGSSRGSSSVYTQPLQPFDPTPEYWSHSTTPSSDPTSITSYQTQPSFPCPVAESEARDFEQARANSLLLQQDDGLLQEQGLSLFVEGSSGGSVGQVDNEVYGYDAMGSMGAMDTSAWDLQFLNCPALDENFFPFVPYQHCESYEREGGDDGQDHRNL